MEFSSSAWFLYTQILFLWECNFCDLKRLVFLAGNQFLWFSGSRVQMELITFSFFLSKWPLKGIEIQIKQHGNVTLLHYNGSKITRIPLDVLSTELSMAFHLQTSIFVYNFYSGVQFCGEKIAVILFCGNLFLRIATKTAKIAKIRTCKN